MTLICFDLEGTLLDPMDGICGTFRTVCEELRVPCPGPEAIAPCIGLDLESLFTMQLRHSGTERPDGVMTRFWQRYGDEEILAQHIYGGVPLLLARLKRQGHRLYVVASQPASLVRRVLHHFDLNLLFDDVIGLGPGERWRPKRDLLQLLAQDGVLNTGGYLIGDRADDMEGGLAHGLRTLGACWGYGSRAELLSSRAERLVDSVQDLDVLLQAELTDPEIHDSFSRSE
jgi:phosphoglycolate phosphatase